MECEARSKQAVQNDGPSDYQSRVIMGDIVDWGTVSGYDWVTWDGTPTGYQHIRYWIILNNLLERISFFSWPGSMNTDIPFVLTIDNVKYKIEPYDQLIYHKATNQIFVNNLNVNFSEPKTETDMCL